MKSVSFLSGSFSFLSSAIDSTPVSLGSICFLGVGDVMSMTHHFCGNGNGQYDSSVIAGRLCISVQGGGIEPWFVLRR